MKVKSISTTSPFKLYLAEFHSSQYLLNEIWCYVHYDEASRLVPTTLYVKQILIDNPNSGMIRREIKDTNNLFTKLVETNDPVYREILFNLIIDESKLL